MRRPTVLFFLAIGFLFTCEASGRPRPEIPQHPYGLEDWAAERSAAAIAVAPDGRTILYRISYGAEQGLEKEEWRLIDRDGRNARKLALPEDFHPFGFSRDGNALYGSFKVKKEAQLAVVPVSGGQPKVLTALSRGIQSAAISPDGQRFAVLADPRPADPLAEVRTVVENDETSLYVVQADGPGRGWWCPALDHIASTAWSPDSRSLAALSSTPKMGHHFVHSFVDVCTAEGARRLADIANVAAGLAWAAQGKELAFVTTRTQVLTPDHLWTVALAGGESRDRTPELAGTVRGVASDLRGNVWVTVDRGMRTEVDAFRRGALFRTYDWPGGSIVGAPVFPATAGAPEALALTVGDPTHTENVAVPEGNELRRITFEGDAQLAKVALGAVRAVHWTEKDGTRLEGIATFPADFVPGKPGKFLLMPHGGPEGNDVLHLDPFARLFAGLGYMVLQPEYRGSTGYGSAFLNSIYQHFGDRPYQDIESGTDYAIARGWADPARLAIFGWSAGGFLTAWTVTQTSRYRAAIEGAGITDWLSFIPTSDIAQTDYDARWPERDAEPFLKFSAIMDADRVTTPLLILHGAADIRVPTFQGRELFILLAERKKTVRMVTYPGSPHFPRLWQQRRNVWEEIQHWLERYDP